MRTFRSLLIVAALAVPALVFTQSSIPTPESVIGFAPGTDYKLVTYDQAIDYFTKVAAVAGDRMKMVTAGKTSEGRTYQFALISSKANLAKIDRYREIARRLAHPEGLTDAEAHALAKEGKVFFHVDGGLHASEVAGAQMSSQMLYDLLANNSRGTDEFLDNVIVMLWPTINPDGMQMVSEWGMAHNGSVNLPRLYQDYVGHDNNRDAYMLDMVESRVMEYTWRTWEPNIIYVFHQSPQPPARIWTPPFADPIAEHAPYRISSELSMIGTAIGKGLDDRGQFGAIHGNTGDRFDSWYAGYIDYNPVFKNIPAFWTETAGNGAVPSPAPAICAPGQAPSGGGRGGGCLEVPRRPDSMYPSPWQGGEWHLRDAVAYDETAALSVLEFASKYKESILYDRYQSGRDQIAGAGKYGAPTAYIFPAAQRDPVAAVELLRRLAFAGLRVSQLTAAATIDDVSYPAGTWVIPADQEFAALAREVLEVQKYPTIPALAGGIVPPYDASGWTLPYTMDVKMAIASKPLGDDVRSKLKLLGPAYSAAITPKPYNMGPDTDAAPFDSAPGIGFDANPNAAAIVPPAGTITGSGPTLAVDPTQNNAFRALNRAWKAGLNVQYQAAAGAPSTTSTGSGPAGSGQAARYLITGLSTQDQDSLVQSLALRAERTTAAGTPMKKPRIALYNSPSSMDDGWTRWVLDQYGFDYTPIAPADFPGTTPLRDRFDVIIVSNDGGGAFGGGGGRGGFGGGRGGRGAAAGAGGAAGAGRTAGAGAQGGAALGAPAMTPEERTKAISDFVNAGGTIVCFARSSQSAISALQLPVKIVATGDRTQFFVGGSVFKVSVDTTQRVTAGMSGDAAVFFDSDPIFQTGEGFKGAVLAKYQDSGSPLMSGFLLGEKFLDGNDAALDVDLGAGHVVLFGFRPQWRGQPFGTFRMIFNAAIDAR